jgi:hypothetical protein
VAALPRISSQIAERIGSCKQSRSSSERTPHRRSGFVIFPFLDFVIKINFAYFNNKPNTVVDI